MYHKQAEFRFYEELNDHLPKEKQKKTFTWQFKGNPTVKDIIEAIGVPHVEVDLVLVNGHSVDFKYKVMNEDRVSVYPVFELLNVDAFSHVRRKPLRKPAFILDTHLGKLCRYLRLLGFDCLYRNDYSDPEIIDIAVSEKRIVLTRDLGILKNDRVTHGYWLRSQDSKKQLNEVLHKFDLFSKINEFSRCIACNGKIRKINKNRIAENLLSNTLQFYDEFFQCTSCKRIYWEGSHFANMKGFIDSIISGNVKD
jgi:uncharacterized protein